MSTVYKTIQIGHSNIEAIKELLHNFKRQHDKEYEIIQSKIDNIVNGLFKFNKPITLISSTRISFITMIADDKELNLEMAGYISSHLSCVCIYAEFYDFEFYNVQIFSSGDCLITVRKDSSDNKSLILSGDNKGIEKQYDNWIEGIEKALEIDDLSDSFCAFEYVFNAFLTTSMKSFDNREINELRSVGCELHFIE